MVLAEILIETRNLKKKINQLMIYIDRISSRDSVITDQATTKLLGLLDKHRSHLILLNKVNNSVEVTVGESTLSLANAIIILKTVKKKIDILDSLIDKEDCVMDVMNVIENRDKLLEEYTVISKEIQQQEWEIEIDQESLG